MKYLGKHNLREIEAVKVLNILGYDVFIPKSYNNPFSYLKKGCPMWICLEEEGSCEIYETRSRESLIADLCQVIKTSYPSKKGYCCCSLSEEIRTKYGISTEDKLGLSAVCFDETESIKAIVAIDSDNNNDNFAYITTVYYEETEALEYLREYVFSNYNIEKHKGLLIVYKGKDARFIEHFGLYKYEGNYAYEYE